MDYSKEFKKYATQHRGISSMYYDTIVSSMTPYIVEERQLNVAQMDVFSRLMMDRIIFLGTEVNSHVANIIQAQLLFLESVDANKDIQIYINSPGGEVYSGLGIYDTMQFIKPDVATIYGRFHGCCIALCWSTRKTLRLTTLPSDDSPTAGRCPRTSQRYRNHCS